VVGDLTAAGRDDRWRSDGPAGQGRTVPADAVLDNPVWAALSGPQSAFAVAGDRAARFQPDISPFAGFADPADPAGWRELASLAGPGVDLGMSADGLAVPPEWDLLRVMPAVQLVGTAVDAAPDPDAVELGDADVPEMLGLVERTQPGPFRKRTLALGRYLGVRYDGALVAMAGERMRVPGFTEISAVCTDPAYRGRGLAARLIRAVAAGIAERGELPFLAAVTENHGALRVYRRIGFTDRRPVTFTVVRTPTG
jgi:ribosomal protein S18 acetylase RimI-like enzyme